jgi:hypothetical protein
MAENQIAHRSRRALLAAAAGGAAALAAQAALPLTAAAATGDPVLLGSENVANTTTRVTILDGSVSDDAFYATAGGVASGVAGYSLYSSGVRGMAASPSGAAAASETSYTGVYGWSAADPANGLATGVWGDSPDFGVYGTGYFGVYGSGVVGVTGQAETTSGPGVHALGATTSSPALKVTGKVSFNRSGRKLIAAGKTSVVVSLAGVTTSSKIFAVMSNNRTGRYVRAVVPGANQFTIYLNASYTSQSYLAWFVID